MKTPLANLIRPIDFDEVVGQKKLIGKNGLIRKIIENNKDIPNMILYGPSGTGKTTIANIIANKILYKTSILNILINCSVSIFMPTVIYLNIHIRVSYNIVHIAHIIITVILLSFEKFLSNIPPKNPTIARPIDVIPRFLPIQISMKTPKIIPNITPLLLPMYRPKNNIKITNKFGIIPAMVRFVNTILCNK